MSPVSAAVVDTEELRFGVMGTAAHLVIVGGPPGLASWGARRLEQLEAKWSRFRPDSELSRLNALPGRPVVVSSETFQVVELAVRAWRLTDGLFDPTVLAALMAAGYDRTFEQIAAMAPADGPEPAPAPSPGCGGIELLPAVPAIVLPPGRMLDLGGIGKGFAADLLVAGLRARGAKGSCVNIGGDLRVDGRAPTVDGWLVGIEHPEDAPLAPPVRLGLASGAVATSTDRRRRWIRSGEERHHLMDPRCGRPGRSPVAAATVLAGEGWLADVLAKVCFLCPERAPAFLDAAGAAAVLIDDGGTVMFINEAEAYQR
jgi:thiamine biosynthesis lipoprotein